MTSPNYRDILELFRQGAAAEAEQQFNALHERTLAQHRENRQQPQYDEAAGIEPERHPRWDGTGYYLVDNGRKIGLFCRRCYEKQGRLEKLQACDSTTYRCQACQSEYVRNLCG
ncbi:MAG: hypothetical protein WC073_01055 [Sterolibacterium sp.]